MTGMLKHYHTSRHGPWRERTSASCDVTGRRKPHTIIRAVHDMLERARQVFKAVWPADNVGMKRDAHHQRTFAALLMHDFESIDDHVSEFGALALARDDLRDVIEFLRIRQ
jgi:hypothetical protein